MESASDPKRIFGWVAVTLSLVYKFPQILKLQRSKDTRGISVESQVVQASAYFFYITHGILINDPPIVFLGITSLCQSLVLVAQYFAFRGQNVDEQKVDDRESESDSDSDSSGSSDTKEKVAPLAIDSESKQGDIRPNDPLLLASAV